MLRVMDRLKRSKLYLFLIGEDEYRQTREESRRERYGKADRRTFDAPEGVGVADRESDKVPL